MLANPLAFLVQSLHFGDTSTLQIARVVHVPAAMKMVRNSELSNEGESEGGGGAREGWGWQRERRGRGSRIERDEGGGGDTHKGREQR